MKLLKECRRYLVGNNYGHIDLAAARPFDDLSAKFMLWQGVPAPFNNFINRCIYDILRKIGEKINIDMEEPSSGHTVRIRSQEALEEAIQSGWKFSPKIYLMEMKNPCGEIVLPGGGSSNLQMPRNESGGSPWSQYINPAQMRLIMRHIYRYVLPLNSRPYIEALPYVHLNQKHMLRVVKNNLPPFVREIIYGFYNEHKVTHWWSHLRDLAYMLSDPGSGEIYTNFVASYCFDAIGPDFGVFKASWKTSTVMELINAVRADEAFHLMPIIADALMDAGCDNEPLLNHLQSQTAEHTLGGWLFRATGRLAS